MGNIMDSVRKPPPKFVKNMWAWAYAVQKLYERDGLTPDNEGFNYGAAINIYKRVAAKYGQSRNAEPLVSLTELTTHTRAELMALRAPVWTVAYRAAWSADDEAHQRLYFQQHFHLATAGHGLTVVEPVFAFRVERHEDGATRDLAVADDIAVWLVENDPDATRFVHQQMREAITNLHVALTDADTVDVSQSIGGIPIAMPTQLDQRETRRLILEAISRFESAVTP